MKSVRVYISGTVQGPMFKKYLEEEGKKIGVRGFLRDMEDGRIELVFEGLNPKVDAMIEVCKSGTKHVQIRNVEIREIRYQGFSGFKISKL